MAIGEEGLSGTNSFKKCFGRRVDFDKLTSKNKVIKFLNF